MESSQEKTARYKEQEAFSKAMLAHFGGGWFSMVAAAFCAGLSGNFFTLILSVAVLNFFLVPAYRDLFDEAQRQWEHLKNGRRPVHDSEQDPQSGATPDGPL